MRTGRISSIITMAIVFILLSSVNLVSGKVQHVVDVSDILSGNPVEINYNGWDWGGVGLDQLTGTGILAFEIEDGTDSAFLFNGVRVGTIREGMPSLFVISLEGVMPGPDPIWVHFQTVNGMTVTISKQDGMLGVPEGGVVIQGTTQYWAGQYLSEFSFPSNVGYNVSITTNADYMGIVDGSISRFGSGDDDFFLRAGSAAGISTIRVISDSPTSFNIDLTVSSYYEGSGTIPPNANPEIYIFEDHMEIGVTDAIYNQNEPQVYISPGDVVGQQVIYGYDLEHVPGNIEVTLYSYDVRTELEGTTVIMFNDNLDMCDVAGKYALIHENEQEMVMGWPDLEPFIITGVVYDIITLDNDRDGYPTVEYLTHDITVFYNGVEIQTTNGPTYVKQPQEYMGVQPDTDDDNPNIPNPAADLDSEGLSNLFEVYTTGSDPGNWDTDGDTISDYDEVFNSEFVDTDGDGLSDSDEINLDTNPLDRDSDNDYFEDGAEKAYWEWRGFTITMDIDSGGEAFLTDSNSDLADSTFGEEYPASVWCDLNYPLLEMDEDIFDSIDYFELDGIEVLRLFTDPSELDDDDDGFIDSAEALYWSVQGYEGVDSDGDGSINVIDTDSDDDGLEDGFEIYEFLTWTNISQMEYFMFYDVWRYYYEFFFDYDATEISNNFPFNSNDYDDYYFSMIDLNLSLSKPLRMVLPANIDTDEDGLVDYDEFYDETLLVSSNPSMDDYYENYLPEDETYEKTNPFWWDSDLDGLSDFTEVNAGYYPFFPDSDFDIIPDSIEDEDMDGFRDSIETGAKLWDTDGDGMDDGYEIKYTFDPLNPGDGSADEDNDGYDFDNSGYIDGDEPFTNYEEYLARTDPFTADTDNDQMNDGFEVYYGLNPKADYDAGEDADDDGIGSYGLYGRHLINDPLTNLEEYNLNTNPINSDTDGDSLPDGWEVYYGTEPIDTNDYSGDIDDGGTGDGVTNYNEYIHYTDPTKSDSDDDLMPDKWEIDNDLMPNYDDSWKDDDFDSATNYEEYLADIDPNNWDTDGDIMPDGYELAHANHNPKNGEDGDDDPDSDYSDNDEEYIRRTDPNNPNTDGDVWEYDGTDAYPLSSDSDGDGVNDVDEDTNSNGVYDEGFDVSDLDSVDTDGDGLWDGKYSIFDGYGPHRYWCGEKTKNTDPADEDSDGDGLDDYMEVWGYQSNPLSKHSDDDDMEDGDEVYHSTNPSHPNMDDTDGDGLEDDVEVIQMRLIASKTDTDDDTIPDAADGKPNGNLKLVVTIKEIIEIHPGVSVFSSGYHLVASATTTAIESGDSYGSITSQPYNPFLKYSYWRPYKDIEFDVIDNIDYFYLHFTLYSENKKTYMNFNFDIAYCVDRGLWYGDDNPNDDDGYGYYTNYNSLDTLQTSPKFSIWFDVKTIETGGIGGDTDGLAPHAEVFYGSDVEDEDTDGDGLDDRWEILYNLNPLMDEKDYSLKLNTNYQDGKIEIPDDPNNIDLRLDSGEFTITAWIKHYDYYSSQSESIIIEKSYNDGENHISWAIGVKYEGRRLFTRINGIDTEVLINSQDRWKIVKDEWFFVAVSYKYDENGEATVLLSALRSKIDKNIYNDFEEIYSDSNIKIKSAQPIQTGNEGSIKIGNSIESNKYWQGEINEIAVYDKYMSFDEIHPLYSYGNWIKKRILTNENIIAYWTFQEGSDTSTVNLVDNEIYQGSLNGDVSWSFSPLEDKIDDDLDGINLMNEYIYGGNPQIIDVFIEVDFVASYDISNIDWLIYNWKTPRYARDLIVSAFLRTGNVYLHFDDKTLEDNTYYLGDGGSKAVQEDKVSIDAGWQSESGEGSFYDYKMNANYFNWDGRKNVFHYIILASHRSGDLWGYGSSSGENVGDDVIIGGSYIASTYIDKKGGLARTVSHELSHNFGMLHSTTVLSDSVLDLNPPIDYPSVMYTSNGGTPAHYTESWFYQTFSYHEKEWEALSFQKYPRSWDVTVTEPQNLGFQRFAFSLD